MSIEQLNNQKITLMCKAEKLTAIKSKLYSNVDIESPMSEAEKQLNKDISEIYSEINKIVKQKRALSK